MVDGVGCCCCEGACGCGRAENEDVEVEGAEVAGVGRTSDPVVCRISEDERAEAADAFDELATAKVLVPECA